MSPKLLIVLLVTLACVGSNPALNTKQEVARTEREERILIEVPLIGTVLMVTFKIAELVMNAIGPVLHYKLTAFTLLANITSWLYQNYFAIIVGTAVLVGYCVMTGTFTEAEYEVDDRLIQAARQLQTGTVKYARIIN